MAVLTDRELEGIRGRAAGARPGPWHPAGSSVDLGDRELVEWERIQGSDYRPTEQDARDAAFIAGSRTDVPALLDYIEQLEQANAELRDIAPTTLICFECGSQRGWRHDVPIRPGVRQTMVMAVACGCVRKAQPLRPYTNEEIAWMNTPGN